MEDKARGETGYLLEAGLALFKLQSTIAMAQPCPDLAKISVKVLIPFATIYECEAAFSTLLHIKTKYRNRLDVTNDMRVALCKTTPKIDELIAAKQVHPSH